MEEEYQERNWPKVSENEWDVILHVLYDNDPRHKFSQLSGLNLSLAVDEINKFLRDELGMYLLKLHYFDKRSSKEILSITGLKKPVERHLLTKTLGHLENILTVAKVIVSRPEGEWDKGSIVLTRPRDLYSYEWISVINGLVARSNGQYSIPEGGIDINSIMSAFKSALHKQEGAYFLMLIHHLGYKQSEIERYCVLAEKEINVESLILEARRDILGILTTKRLIN